MISHTGTVTRDIGPHCSKCQVRAVRFEGAVCVACRDEIRGNRALWAVVWIFIGAMALMMAASQAVGTWMALNVDGYKFGANASPGVKGQ